MLKSRVCSCFVRAFLHLHFWISLVKDTFYWRLEYVSYFIRHLVVWKAFTSVKYTSLSCLYCTLSQENDEDNFQKLLTSFTLKSTHCCPQMEPHILWDQCGQLRVQRGALLLCVCGGSGRLLLPSGWPRTNIAGLVSRRQCLQRRLFLYQHLLGLVWQRVWVAGWLLVGRITADFIQ